MCEQRALTSLKAKHFEDGLAWCQRGLAVDPQNKVLSGLQQDMHLLAAEAEWEKGAIEEATSLWKSMSQSGNSFDAAWNRAVASERSRETKDMIQAWQDVIKLAQEQSNPEVALEAILRTASLYWRLGDGDQARSLLEQASKLSSKEPTAHRLLALMSLSRDMDENSSQSVKTVLERAHAAQPDDPLINLALAAAHDDSDAPLEIKIERWHEALKHVDEKDWVQGVWRERTLELGLSAWKKGDLDRAMTIFSGILLEDRFDPDGWIWCGTIHLQLGKEDLARVCFDKALTNAPKSAHTLLKIGGCYLMAGREDEAHQHFAQAQKADPSSATDLQIAEVCLEIGRKDIAFKHLSEAINRSDSHSSDLYRIAQLLIQVNEGQVLRPLLEKLASVIDKPYRMHFLIAVEQIWASEWREAQNTLEQIREAAESHDDSQLLDDVRHAERTMILLLTTGEVDPVESSDRVKLATNRWVLEQSPAEDVRQ